MPIEKGADSAGGANAAERRRWNDDRWTRAWTAREALTEPAQPALLEALGARPGERIVDVGSGGGRSAIAVARQVAPGGTVIGADLSTALCDLARRRAAEQSVHDVAFVVADAQTGDLPGGPFDAAVSSFGVMFFDNPPAAFANLRRQLRGDGRLVFACWQSPAANPWHSGHALKAFVPTPVPPASGARPPGPFSLGEPTETTAILVAAGFTEVRHDFHSALLAAPAGAVHDTAAMSAMGVPDEHLAEAEAAVKAHLARFAATGDRYELPLAYAIWSARVG